MSSGVKKRSRLVFRWSFVSSCEEFESVTRLTDFNASIVFFLSCDRTRESEEEESILFTTMAKRIHLYPNSMISELGMQPRKEGTLLPPMDSGTPNCFTDSSLETTTSIFLTALREETT